jgi:predicted protein tyrosine phosphatase
VTLLCRMQSVTGHPPILILGYSESAMFLRRATRTDIAGMVSICGSHEPALECDLPHALVLHFDDVEPPDPHDPLSKYRTWLRQKSAAETGRTQTPPSAEDVRRVIDFADGRREAEGAILFQCFGGMSRSAAAALIWTGDGEEPYCAQQVMRVRPSAVPLAGLVRIADELLSRDGRLIRAIQECRSRDGSWDMSNAPSA